jgi:mono/diheme cytochrome c family protein
MGRLAFRGQCAAECHPGAGAWTGGKYPNLFDCEWIHGGTDAEIFRTVTSGVPKTEMLSFQAKLADDVIWKIMAYLRSASLCKEGVPTLAPAH